MRKLLYGLTATAVTAVLFALPVTPVDAAGANMTLIVKPAKTKTQSSVKKAHCRVVRHCHRRGRVRYCHRCG